MARKHPCRIERHLPPVGTTLTAKFKMKPYQAKIVKSHDFREGKAVSLHGELYGSMTAAAKAVTKQSINGWRFWKIVDSK